MFLFSFFCCEIILKDHLRQKFRKCCSRKAGSLMVTSSKFQKERIKETFNKPAQTNNKLVLFIYLVCIYPQNSKVWHWKHRKFVFERVRISRVPTYCEDSNISRKSTVLQQKCPTSFSSKSQTPYRKVRRWAFSIKQNLRFGLGFCASLLQKI